MPVVTSTDSQNAVMEVVYSLYSLGRETEDLELSYQSNH